LHACLGFVVREQVQPWLLATPEGPVSIVPRGPLTSTSKEVLIETAVGGLGIVRVADVMVSALLKARALETVLDEHAVTERQPVFVARRSGRWLPQRTRVVFQFLLDLFASRDDR
jgi:DNA-binding transcriptional LysR family regulator